MKLFQRIDGLAARQWAIDRSKTITSRIRRVSHRVKLWGIVAALALCTSCQENYKGQHTAENKTQEPFAAVDSLDKPKVSIKVNRRYDDKGNLVGFDSTYSSYYSNVRGDTIKMDSLIHGFDSYFNHNRSFLFDDHFNNLFFNDSTRYPDFFHNDFFLKRYELNDAYMRDMMERMDSMKNRFFYEQSEKEKKSKDL
jgi:hypothetical protein